MASEKLEIIITATDKASSVLGSLGRSIGGLGGLLGGAVSTAGGFLLADGISAAAGAVKGLVGEMVSGNAEFERYQTQFGVLLGGAEAAQERLDELTRFGARTPFELPEVVEASKVLQTFGGDALATGDMLELAGDLAAASGEPFNALAVHFGRLFDAMQSGRPFGESAARLQELGLLTGEMRGRLEEMQKAGADGADIWAVFVESMSDNFGGMMEEQSSTLEGMVSNFVDWKDNVIRTLGEPLFEGVKEQLGGLLETLNTPEMQERIEALAAALSEGLGAALDTLTPAVDGLMAFLSGDFSLKDAIPSDAVTQLEPLVSAFQNLSSAFQEQLPAMQEAGQKFVEWLQGAFGELGPKMLEHITSIVNSTAELWREYGDEIVFALTFAFEIIVATLAGAMELILGYVDAALLLLQGNWQGAWNAIVGTLQSFMNLALSIVGTNLEQFTVQWRSNWEMAVLIIKTMWQRMVTAISEKLTEMRENIQNWVTQRLAWLAQKREDFKNIARDWIQGMIDGFLEMARGLAETAANVVGGIVQAARNILDANSPSRVAMQLGRDYMEGLAIGLRQAVSMPEAALAGLGNLGSSLTPARLTGSGITVNVTYAPTFSLADEREFREQFEPVLIDALRGLT